MRELEDEIEQHAKAYAIGRGCMVEKLQIVGARGWPDLTILAPNGVVGFLEMKKTGGGIVSPQQNFYLAEMKKRNVPHAVADSRKAAEDFIDSLFWKS